ISDPPLQDGVFRQTYGVFDPFGFEELVDLGIRKAGIGPKINARDLASVTRHDRVEHFLPAVRAVDVAGTQSAAFQITELVEHEQRMITGADIVAVPDAVLLFAVRRATLESISSTTPLGGRRPWTISIRRPERSASAD